ncbi:MAG: replication-associated recombination protein A [Deltaproteobacteria bacterium]|nr:replication-associated recombination protein A [Deltaproteobacteria bacterium]
MDLFEKQDKELEKQSAPLADRMRQETLQEFVGQSHLLGPGSLLRHAIEEDKLFSVIFWGPPGVGKTTLARIMANDTKAHFEMFSAVLSGVKEIRAVIEEAKSQLRYYQRKTILFVDEIHRFNKAQQDAFLPHVESGLITLIGATTENPSFEVIAPLLSRTRVMVLQPYSDEELHMILQRALDNKEKGFGLLALEIEKDALSHIIWAADGDARAVLNNLEAAVSLVRKKDGSVKRITKAIVEKALQKKVLQYDKSGEEHYNLISAFHKSLRGSDPDAALYWLGRMLEAGEDPLYIARRMVRFASEDIGNADPSALTIALSAMQAFHFIGLPEGELALAQAAVYLATAPKSNALYTGYGKVKDTIKKTGTLPVPLHIRNAPTKLMTEIGYGKNYKYAHDYKDAYVPQEYLPEELRDRRFYTPTARGYEKIIKEHLDKWLKIKKAKRED